ncbi:unnamed protein product, partial [Symbiodinium necroappetens]
EYGRCMCLYSCLKPKEWWDNRGVEGFHTQNDIFTRPEVIPATRYRDVLMAPSLLGLFKAGKILPPDLNLVLEIEFAPPAEAVRPGDAGSVDYEIQNVRVLASQVTLDSALVESFRRVLLSGRSLVFSFNSVHAHASVLDPRRGDQPQRPVRDLRNPSQTEGVEGTMESQTQLGSLQYPHNPMSSTAEHFHFLSIFAHTYDSSIKNMRINTDTYRFREFIAAFPTERVPGMPLSGISTRSGDLARFSFKNLAADAVDRIYLHLLSYQVVTLSGGSCTVLTAYTPLTDTATNTADISTNSAAVAALQAQLGGLPAAPDLAPYALAADLAAAEGSIAANQSSITALNTSLTTGLAGKANQSALDALQLEVDGKSTPASVDLKLANHPTTAAMNSAIASADNAVLASVAATYGLKTVTDQLALDVAARQTAADVDQKIDHAADVDQKIATALLPYTDASGLSAAVALRTTPADVDQKIAPALLPYTDTSGLNTTVALRTTPADVDQKIATALLTYVQQAALDAALALRDGRLDAAEVSIATLQAAGYQTSTQVSSAIAAALVGYATTADLANYATSADLTATETSLESAIDAILAQLALLSTGGGNNLINVQAWPGEVTWDLLVGTNTLRNLHVVAPLSASLQNDSFTLSLTCDSYSKAESDSNLAAALVPYYTSAQVDGAIAAVLVPYSTTVQMDAAIAAALVPYSTTVQMDAAIAAAVAGIDLSAYYTAAQTDAAIAAALVPVALSNAPAWAGNTTWELLKGSNVIRNLHFAGPLVATLVNNTDTLQIECQAYSTAQTLTQAETNAAISAAIDALNITQYVVQADVDSSISSALTNYWDQGETSSEIANQISTALAGYYTDSQTDTAISDALTPYYTSAQTDTAISAAVTGAGYQTQAQADARYFVVNGNAGGGDIIPMVLDQFTPRMVRALLPRAPLSANLILGNQGTVELECDCWSKGESDARYFSNTDFTTLDNRYYMNNGNNEAGGIFQLMLTQFNPRIIRALLPRAPLTATPILGNGATLELEVD